MQHIPKLVDKMCKYKMDPVNIVEDTEKTRFCPQTDGRTDRRIPSTSFSGGMKWSIFPSILTIDLITTGVPFINIYLLVVHMINLFDMYSVSKNGLIWTVDD